MSVHSEMPASRPLHAVFLERVIRIEAVQRERAQVAKSGVAATRRTRTKAKGEIARLRELAFNPRGGKVIKDYAEPFFEYGFICGTASSLWPVGGAPLPFPEESEGFQMSPPMQRAWVAAVEEWLLLCADLRKGRLITEGNDLFTGRRVEIAPAVWLDAGVWFDVRANSPCCP